jgi:uroporphyrinogen-III synthase
MQSNVFISRELTAASVFLQLVQAADFRVIGESLVAFKAIPFSTLPEVDWVFFYSQQAVRFFFQPLRQVGLPLQARLAALGSGTAQALQNEGYQADFTGTGNPPQTANYFLPLAKQQKVLFPRAAHSRQSVQQLLEKDVQVVDLIVYENTLRTDFELPVCDWLVFTSPLNARAYFAKYEWKPTQQVVAIGTTTAQTLQLLGIPNVQIAEEPSETALAQCVLKSLSVK